MTTIDERAAQAEASAGVADASVAPAEPAEKKAAPGKAVFLTGGLMGHVLRMSSAGAVGLTAIFLVDLADLYFISLLGQQELAAAVGYAAATLFLTTSLGIGLAIAVGALVSRALGAGDPDRARVLATHALVFGFGVALVALAILLPLLPEAAAFMGATGETAELTVRYLSIVAPSLPFMLALMAAGAILRAHGDARASMTATLVAAAVNAALDPLLIFGFGLGLDGAAMATVAARLAGAAAGLAPILSKYGGFAPVTLAGLRADARPVFALAGPAMLTNLATPVGFAFVTQQLAPYGDAAVAGYAIIGRLTPVVFAIVFALSGAVGPIVGQNAGAAQYVRVRDALTASIQFLFLYTLVAAALLFLMRGLIADAFSATGEARDLLFWFCGPLALAFFFNGLLFTANAGFNNLGRPVYSAWANWGRNTVGTMPTALLAAAWLGAPGVLLGQAIGGVIFGTLAMLAAYRLVDRQAEKEGAAAPSGAPERAPLWRAPVWPSSFWRG